MPAITRNTYRFARLILVLGLTLTLATFVQLTAPTTAAASLCATFVADLNYPDGAAVTAGQSFEKAWRLRNCGSSSWSGVSAVRVAGSFGPSSFGVPAAGAGATADLRASITAPSGTGRYRATYQLQGPSGRFGNQFWVEIQVNAPAPAPAPTPQAPAPQPASWRASLTASTTNAAANQAVTLTTTASQNVGPTPYYLQIVDQNGSIAQSCSNGTTCSVQVAASGTSRTYRARVSKGDGSQSQATSGSVTVTWAGASSPPGSKQLDVPYVSQLVQTATGLKGQNNCGPASVAMTIQMYRGVGSIDLNAAAIAIRGYNNNSNSTTDFKSSATDALLGRFGLVRADVSSFDAIKSHLTAGHPVIVLVDNGRYIHDGKPYPNTSAWVQAHIVVVTGYDQNNIYINDPLAYTASGKNFRVSNDDFKAAAGAKRWYASAIVPR